MEHGNGSRTGEKGFSLLELVAVVAVMSILAGISIPAFLNFVKSARIDQAKATLNSAVAECLQLTRTDPDNAGSAKVPQDKLAGLESAGYKIFNDKDKCSDFMIEPSDKDERYLFHLGFMVRSGKVTKIAIPARDRASQKACEAWGTCGIPPELQAEWDRIAAIEKAKKECNENFYTWLKKPSSGTNNRWDDASNTCSIVTWAFEGSIQPNEAAYKEAEKKKYGEICAKKTEDIKNEKMMTGEYQIKECGQRQFFFCLGEDKGSKEAMDVCVLENAEAKCISDENAALKSGHQGMYGGKEGPPRCGNIVWMCEGVMVDSEDEFKLLQAQKQACGYEPPCPAEGPCKQKLCIPAPEKKADWCSILKTKPACNLWAWCNDLTEFTGNFEW